METQTQIEIITFQGGGVYDERGQVIHVAVMSSGNIMMIDASRGLDYVFRPMRFPVDVKEYVMSRYLHNDTIGDHYLDEESQEIYRAMITQIQKR